jgi:hypothetical protein
VQYKIEDKKRFVAEWARSKVSRRKYSQKVGVGYGTFAKWCKKYFLVKAEKRKGSGFVEVSEKIFDNQRSEIVIEFGEIKIYLPISAAFNEITTVLEAARQVSK